MLQNHSKTIVYLCFNQVSLLLYQVLPAKFNFANKLQLIYLSPVLYHTIRLDFISTLPKSKRSYNAVMLLINKYSKKILLFLKKTIYTAVNQAKTLVECLDLVNQKISKVIISDHDLKFFLDLWMALHKRLDLDFCAASLTVKNIIKLNTYSLQNLILYDLQKSHKLQKSYSNLNSILLAQEFIAEAN